MKMFKRMMAATAIVIFGFTLYACGSGGVSASDTLSAGQVAQVQALINTALSSSSTSKQLAELRLIGYSGKTAASTARTTMSLKITRPAAVPMSISGSSTCTNLGVVISDDPVHDIIVFQTCTGYIYTVNAKTGDIINNGLAIMYDAPGCTGNAYLASDFTYSGTQMGVSKQFLDQGTVIPDGAGSLYELSNSATLATANIQSYSVAGTCQTGTFSNLSVYALTGDNATATGVSAANVGSNIAFGPPA